LSTSPVVDSQTTAWYRARFCVVNALASSVASTVNPFWAPRLRIAVIPAGIESCRNPAVLENTSTLVRGAADAVCGNTASPAATEPSAPMPRNTVRREM
jgi:hypothetical protein